VVKRLEKRLDMPAQIAFEPQILGALGAAAFARDLAARKENRRGRRRQRPSQRSL
jgi:hypothetical protein